LRRREFISLVGGAVMTWPPHITRAQQSERMRRIGLLMLVAEIDPQAQAELAAFATELQHLGWTEGQNIRIDQRWANGDVARLQVLATELVDLEPDLLVGQGSAALAALQQATRTLPIVFASVTDPWARALSKAWRGRAATLLGSQCSRCRWAKNGLICLESWRHPPSTLRFCPTR